LSEKTASLPAGPPPELPEDANSLGEAIGLAAGIDLSNREQLNRLNQLIRDDGVQGHIHKVLVCGVYVVAVCAGLMFVVLVMHYICPSYFLSAQAADDLQTFLFSGTVGGIVTKGAGSISRKDKAKR
jgi:hypothetical protein